MFPYGWYYRFSQFMKETFGGRVVKIPVHAGFSCPNRDGRVGYGGCTYCYNPSFSPVAEEKKSVSQQISEGKSRAKRSRKAVKFLAYFQSYTNTYAPLPVLKELYDEALADEEVVGLSIATRPDCISEEILELLQEYARTYHVWLEYGLQSIHDNTLRRINRGHTASQFVEAVQLTRNRGIYIGAHIILGLPGETERHMLQTVRALNKLEVDGVKLHHLQVIENTPLAEEFRRGEFQALTFADYLHLLCHVLEHLSPRIVIHRLIGEVLDDDLLIAPRWGLAKAEIIRAVEQELLRRKSYQGKKYVG